MKQRDGANRKQHKKHMRYGEDTMLLPGISEDKENLISGRFSGRMEQEPYLRGKC